MEKTNYPDSDTSARKRNPDSDEDDLIPEVDTPVTDLQTSNKSGKHSTAEKLAGSRPGYGTGRGAVPVDGAFGSDAGEDTVHPITGRNAAPGTNEFQCESCGRFFNTEAEVSAHEVECRLAKQATAAGSR